MCDDNLNLDPLFKKNRDWAARITAQDPVFFQKLSKQQAPEYLWIGCSDSRVPANEIVDLLPGELFVHRNVANVVVHMDLNCLSVMQFAVDVLKVKHIMVVGHYGCGGIHAALEDKRLGLVDNWLRHVQDVKDKHQAVLDRTVADERENRLCELNVIEQVANVCLTSIVQDAWKRGQFLVVHGWVYSLQNGHLRDMGTTIASEKERLATYQQALAKLA